MWAGGASRNDGQLTLNNNIAESINVAQLGVDGIYEVRASFEMPDNSSEICLGINLINDTDRGWRACLKATTFNLDFPSGNGTGTTISRRNTGVIIMTISPEGTSARVQFADGTGAAIPLQNQGLGDGGRLLLQATVGNVTPIRVDNVSVERID